MNRSVFFFFKFRFLTSSGVNDLVYFQLWWRRRQTTCGSWPFWRLCSCCWWWSGWSPSSFARGTGSSSKQARSGPSKRAPRWTPLRCTFFPFNVVLISLWPPKILQIKHLEFGFKTNSKPSLHTKTTPCVYLLPLDSETLPSRSEVQPFMFLLRLLTAAVVANQACSKD